LPLVSIEFGMFRPGATANAESGRARASRCLWHCTRSRITSRMSAWSISLRADGFIGRHPPTATTWPDRARAPRGAA